MQVASCQGLQPQTGLKQAKYVWLTIDVASYPWSGSHSLHIVLHYSIACFVAVRSAVSAPPSPVARPRKHQTSHADDVAAKDAPLKSLFPSEPKFDKVSDHAPLD